MPPTVDVSSVRDWNCDQGTRQMGDGRRVRVDTALREMLSDPAPAQVPQRRRWLDQGSLRLWVVLLDIVLTMGSGLLLSAVLPTPGLSSWQVLGAGAIVALMVMLARRGMRPSTVRQPEGPHFEALRATAAVVLAFALALGCSSLLSAPWHAVAPLAWFGTWALVCAALAVGVRLGAAALTARPDGAFTSIAVVGPPLQAASLARLLSATGGHDWRIVANLRSDAPEDLASLDGLIGQGKVNVVAMAGVSGEVARTLCDRYADSPARVCIGFDASALEAAPRSVTRLGNLPLLQLLPDPLDGWRGAMKRAFDIGFVLMLLPVLAPVLGLAALAIKIELPGPVLFRQWRFGLGSRPTQVLKFRSMYHERSDSTGEARTLARDPRVTRVGRILRRTSIDELPQLINVLRGDMSLVGPRPHATHMKVEGTYYFEAVESYRARHRVKPGITGWAQINGSRGEVDTFDKARRRIELDLWYINNWSFTLDMWIILRTAFGGFATMKAD